MPDTELFPISQLTPPALTDLVESVGGGMVQSVIFAAEIITAEGDRRFFCVWDQESSLANQIGLMHFLQNGLDCRMIEGFDDE